MSQYPLKFFNLVFTFTLVFITGMSVNIQPALADDTDIYLNPVTPVGSEPLVMFSVDYRANMDSVVCNPAGAPFTVAGTAPTDAEVATAVAAIQAAAGCTTFGTQLAETLVDDSAVNNAKITLFEVIRGALRVVLDSISGVKIGLMMPHGADNNCAGPQIVGNNQAGCSNGAMIMMGFSSLVENDTNGNKAAFYEILRSIPATDDSPGFPDYHGYQAKEMYFEFFRYLTGQDIYNGHNGWTDFDTAGCTGDTKTYNLGNLTPITVNDNFYRRVYSTTVTLRNPMNSQRF